MQYITYIYTEAYKGFCSGVFIIKAVKCLGWGRCPLRVRIQGYGAAGGQGLPRSHQVLDNICSTEPRTNQALENFIGRQTNIIFSWNIQYTIKYNIVDTHGRSCRVFSHFLFLPYLLICQNF